MKRFKCASCARAFDTDFCRLLHEHFHRENTTFKRFQCKVCQRKFGQVRSFVNHKTLHKIVVPKSKRRNVAWRSLNLQRRGNRPRTEVNNTNDLHLGAQTDSRLQSKRDTKSDKVLEKPITGKTGEYRRACLPLHDFNRTVMPGNLFYVECQQRQNRPAFQ